MILECVHSHDTYYFRKWSLIPLPQTSDFLLMIKVEVTASIHLLSLGHYKKLRLLFYSPVGHSLRGKPAAIPRGYIRRKVNREPKPPANSHTSELLSEDVQP